MKTAAETIQAAIDKLLATVNTEADMVGHWRAEVHTAKAASIFDSDDVPVALDIAPIDAETIVTLHRTIDAQLAILRTSQSALRAGVGVGVVNDALDLARAILGEVDQ